MKTDQLFSHAVAFLVGAGIGGVAAVLIWQKKIDKHYRDISNMEIESVKDAYKLLRKEPPYDDPQTAVEAYLERLDELQYLSEGGEPLPDEPEDAEPKPYISKVKVTHNNVFDESLLEDNPEVMTEAEMEDGALFGDRNPDFPYVISFQEFMDEREEYEKISIEYYEGDNTLADEREQIIVDVDGTVGVRNLGRFGQGSQDPAIVYIRNESLGADFEVAHNDKGYAEVVLGINEPKAKRRVPRMREDD